MLSFIRRQQIKKRARVKEGRLNQTIVVRTCGQPECYMPRRILCYNLVMIDYKLRPVNVKCFVHLGESAELTEHYTISVTNSVAW